MNNILKLGRKNIDFSVMFSWLMKIILLTIFFIDFYHHHFLVALAALVALFISLLPFIISRNYFLNLPWQIDFFITLALFLHLIGLFYDFYHHPKLYWWDILTHFLGTAVIAALAFYIIFALNYTEKIKLGLPLMALSTVTTALAIGAFWEILEYYFDWLFGTQAVIDLQDTIHDLIFDLLAGSVVAIIGAAYANYLKKENNGQ